MFVNIDTFQTMFVKLHKIFVMLHLVFVVLECSTTMFVMLQRGSLPKNSQAPRGQKHRAHTPTECASRQTNHTRSGGGVSTPHERFNVVKRHNEVSTERAWY